MKRVERLMRIVHLLRQSRLAMRAECLAGEFGVSTRTIYRDMQDLMLFGAPISGAAGTGYIIDKSYYLPPLTFSKDESWRRYAWD